MTPIDARCLVCGRVFCQGVGGNTSNLRAHLRSHDVYVQPVMSRTLSASDVAATEWRRPGILNRSGGSGGMGVGDDGIGLLIGQIQTPDGTVLDIREETLEPGDTLGLGSHGHGAGKV